MQKCHGTTRWSVLHGMGLHGVVCYMAWNYTLLAKLTFISGESFHWPSSHNVTPVLHTDGPLRVQTCRNAIMCQYVCALILTACLRRHLCDTTIQSFRTDTPGSCTLKYESSSVKHLPLHTVKVTTTCVSSVADWSFYSGMQLVS